MTISSLQALQQIDDATYLLLKQNRIIDEDEQKNIQKIQFVSVSASVGLRPYSPKLCMFA
jgi:hypothetical protein